MVKIDSAANLTVNNFIIQTVDLDQRTTLSINAGASTISDTANEFQTADGVGFAVDDVIRISFLDSSNPNNGTARITNVTAGTITIADHTGTLTTQAVGQAGNIHRIRKTFQFAEQDGLDFADGVSLSAIATRLYDLFDSGDLERFDPPIVETEPRAKVITFRNGWEPFNGPGHNNATLLAIRDGAIRILDGVTGAVSREYANVESAILLPAALRGTHRVSYWFSEDQGVGVDPLLSAAEQSVTTDQINQLILIRDVPNSIDRTTEDFELFLKMAVPGYTIDLRNLNEELNLTGLQPERYRTGLNIALDLKLADVNGAPLTPDATIASQAPYTTFTYLLLTPTEVRTVEPGLDATFAAEITRAGGTKEQIHEWLHWLARQNSSVRGSPDGTYLGAISAFLGEQITFQGYASGTPATENNDTVYIDENGAAVRTAQEASFTIAFRLGNALGAETAKFRVFLANSYNTDTAIIVQDKAGVDMASVPASTDTNLVDLTGDDERQFSISYSTFNQGGHTPNTPIPIAITLSSPRALVPSTDLFEIENNTTQRFVVNGVASSIVRF